MATDDELFADVAETMHDAAAKVLAEQAIDLMARSFYLREKFESERARTDPEYRATLVEELFAQQEEMRQLLRAGGEVDW
ncbi:hypothetical protein OWR29_27245 [Actinoplanes sp. Pm04-4]|uniref:Uncharacterized protein n=1 Tax=Paractinoplanes pyxinae TaxID=2997416 RepID=A0ABT4B5D8_9ACTN|nr:hypothetical protein [Actinoplanes pyxinae]MCY1141710.1 hypothetical protein [Actinoplanes pyxinae]